MNKKLFMAILIYIFLLSNTPICAAEPITDTNSAQKFACYIENLPSETLVNLTFKSKIDDSYQPMLAKTPKGYMKTKSWPLLVVLHGFRDRPIIVPSINSMVQIGPFGRGDLQYRNLGERDVFECVELSKQLFNIDPNRIYLCGFSMGGTGTFELGLKYPDTWAACVPVCGNITCLDMVTNANNLPFWINTGGKDKVVPAKYSKRAYEKAIELGFEHWKYTEYKNMGHNFRIDWENIERWLLRQKRIQKPSNISFACENPSRAYWAEITAKLNCTRTAHINAKTVSQKIKVKTFNVANYMLYLKDAPVKIGEEITIIENNIEIFHGFSAEDGTFNKEFYDKKTDKACTQ